MNHPFLLVTFCRRLLVLFVASSNGVMSAQVTPARVPGRILIKPKQTSSEVAISSALAAQGAAQIGNIQKINVRIARVPDAKLDTVLAALRRNPNIEFAEPDYLFEPSMVPNDTYYSLAWHLPKVNATAAWDTTTGSDTITIAILDSGIDSSHPDLAGRIVTGYNFYDGNTNLTDVTGHGTAVAGTAVANGNNGVGIAAIT